MRIASITPVYNSENFLPAFLKQISVFDENIFLLGEEPFTDYLAAGLVTKEKDKSRHILDRVNVHVVPHKIKYYSGELFNLGIDKARDLDCQVIVKLDPDMFLEKQSMDILLDRARNISSNAYTLDMKSNTMVYEQDFDHGVTQALWHVGGEPFVVRTDARFAEDGTNIHVDGAEMIDWPNFMIHHFSGFKRNIVEEVEKMEKFPGWSKCPKEIKDLFNA